MSAVAVFDVGKTNVKLSAVAEDGTLLETVSTGNAPRPGPPYLHVDLEAIETFLLGALPGLARRHAVAAIVTTGHGSAGVLVDDNGPVLPMFDYEQELPADVVAAYAALAGPPEERGSPIMGGAAHLARQILWLQRDWPEALARGRFFLGGPQYWAWRLSGVAATEVTYAAAQSHLWDIRGRRFSRLAMEQGWTRLLPPLAPAWARLGPLRPDLAERLDLAQCIEVLCGIHDSSANFYRYQQGGLRDLAVVSTGTWIVGLCDRFDPAALATTSGMTWNADVDGAPLTGMLAMGGREFALIDGSTGEQGGADAGDVAALVASATMALPSFAADDGPFAGSGGRGRIAGPAPATPQARRALALLYVALLTDACLERMGTADTTILDGSFVRDPLYPALVAALRRGRRTLFNADAYGTASGAGLLAAHGRRQGAAEIALDTPPPLDLPGLDAYRRDWLCLAGASAAPFPQAAMGQS